MSTSLWAILISVLVPLAFQVWTYLDQKKRELKDRRFEIYHRLIRELVGASNERPFLDHQIAIVFELRNFPEYAEVTERILSGLKEGWSKDSQQTDANKRLISEIDLTLEFLKASKRRR